MRRRVTPRAAAHADMAHARGNLSGGARLSDRRHPRRADRRLVWARTPGFRGWPGLLPGRAGRSRRSGQRPLWSRPSGQDLHHITDRYAPLHQTVIAGTAGEAIHALDGLLGHDSNADLTALHVDGGGVSDIVFATMHLLGLDFEPRIPRLSDRRLYAFEPSKRYGRPAPLFGHRLNRDLIVSHWPDIERVIGAMRDRTVTTSLILKTLSAYRQQNSLAAALREGGRIERTLFPLRSFDYPALRRQVTAELNKGEARNKIGRAHV